MQFLKTQRVGSFFFAAALTLPLWLGSQPQDTQQIQRSSLVSAPYPNQAQPSQGQPNQAQPNQAPEDPQNPNQQQNPSQSPAQSPQEQPTPQPHNPPVIGTINYVEGEAFIGNEPLSPSSVGNVVLQEGETLTTKAGKVEILLTPGVFFRVGDNSAARMVSPSLSNTEVSLTSGQATLEVSQIQKENDIVVDLPGGNTRVLKKGFYEFDANQSTVRVFKGEAQAEANGKSIKIKEMHELALNGPRPKPREFKKEQYDTADLYRWSVLRSSYLAEANVDAASRYVNSPHFSAGWYWDPWFATYTWVPGDGVFYSPFGWGFYSPFYVYDAPFFYYGYYGGPYRRRFDRDFHAWSPGPHYGPHPMWHGDGGLDRGGHAYRGFGGGMHENPGFRGGGGFHGGGGFRGGGGGRGR
jgi:uncharacterized membrane protein YgcG